MADGTGGMAVKAIGRDAAEEMLQSAPNRSIMMKARCYYTLFLTLAVVLAGCGRSSWPVGRAGKVTRLPATCTALHQRVTLTKVARDANGNVWVEIHLRWLQEDPLNRTIHGGVTLSPKSDEIKSTVRGLEDSMIEHNSYHVPSSVERLAISKELVFHEVGRFKFADFSFGQPGITKRARKCEVTLRKATMVPARSSNWSQPYPTAQIDLGITPGFEFEDMKLTDERGRVMTSAGSMESTSGDGPVSWSGGFVLGREPPRKLTLEFTCVKELSAWAKFENVPITPARGTRPQMNKQK